MTDEISKDKVIDNLCSQLNIEDYTQLENGIAQLLGVATDPLWGVTIVWKPRIPGSQQITVLGIPSTPQAAHQVSDILTMAARQFISQALQMALQQNKPEIPDEVIDDTREDNRKPLGQS